MVGGQGCPPTGSGLSGAQLRKAVELLLLSLKFYTVSIFVCCVHVLVFLFLSFFSLSAKVEYIHSIFILYWELFQHSFKAYAVLPVQGLVMFVCIIILATILRRWTRSDLSVYVCKQEIEM